MDCCLEQKAQQHPYLVPDLLHADLCAQLLVIVLGADAGAGLYNFKAIAQYRPYHGCLSAHGDFG